MGDTHQQIDSFFNSYAEIFNKGIKGESSDAEETARFFADCCIAANPDGVNCGKNDDEFRVMIPRGYDFYKNIGIISMEIVSKEITILDDYHTMTKVHWKCGFVKKDNSSGSLEFDVIYFLQKTISEHKIFAYITGNEQTALKMYGLID